MLPIRLKGARTNNLKSVDLELQPGEVVAVTGVSGAGKSSLAFDTLYAEGQRRFVESFSPYVRQFLERRERPPVESLNPVAAAVAVDRAAPVKSSRSTVATMADLEPLMAALFLRESVPICPVHNAPARRETPTSIAGELIRERDGRRLLIGFSRPVSSTEHYLEVRDSFAEHGFSRLRLAGEVRKLDTIKPTEVAAAGVAEVVVDRVKVSQRGHRRLAESLELSLRTGSGSAWAAEADPEEAESKGGKLALSTALACPQCSEAGEVREFIEPRAGLFSYASAVGACSNCKGFGRIIGLDLDKVIPDPTLTLKKRAIRPWNGTSTAWERAELNKLCKRHGVPLDVPWCELTRAQQEIILGGDGGWSKTTFPGVKGWFKWLETRTYKMHVRVLLSRYRSYDPCPTCKGRRLNETALSYKVDGLSIADWHELEVRDLVKRVESLEPLTKQGQLVRQELASRLAYLEDVGLGYLTLERQARTLSGGEAQRVTLTAALGTSLHNALFVLDEPSVGLHASDLPPLRTAISRLAERNNAVVVVEHEASLIDAADRIVELGPGAGRSGGELVFDGSVENARSAGGATARAFQVAGLSGVATRKPKGWIEVQKVTLNNLRQANFSVPTQVLVAITGPSGSGKTSFAVGVLYRALARRLGDSSVERPGPHAGLTGGEGLKKALLVDQSPLGRTSRGNPATYTKAWDTVRKLFSKEPAAEQGGFGASHFSFNVDGGRCEACKGDGAEVVEMQFLADVRLSCPVCQGRRFKDAVLSVQCRGKNVAEVLLATVDEVAELFFDVPALVRCLNPLQRLGLGYLTLGQSLSTLSGGEAQRLKLARAMGDKEPNQLLIVDEPSAGLHVDEVQRVLECLNLIVDRGGTVVMVEHDLALVERADWLIDLGPGAGKAGGQVVAADVPAAVAKGDSATGRALRERQQQGAKKTRARPKQRPAARSGKKESRLALTVTNAREHTLKDVSVEVPHAKLTVVTGPSGSGKSSLVFDVLFAEGQRRFLETLSPYARQFLPTLPKPDVDAVSGVPPSIALEQRTTRAGVNSTVATVTEVAHYLRLLFAKLGTAYCPDHGEPITTVSRHEVLKQIGRLKGKGSLLAPVVESRKGTHLEVFNKADRAGYAYVWADGRRERSAQPPKLYKTKTHDIEVEVAAAMKLSTMTQELLDEALAWGGGSVLIVDSQGKRTRFSTLSACKRCGLSVPELDPRWFSFNTEQGRCSVCHGAGEVEAGANAGSPQGRGRRRKKKRGKKTATALVTCGACDGGRLAAIPRAVALDGITYNELTALSVQRFSKRLAAMSFLGDRLLIAKPVVRELTRRVEFLLTVGLGYLSLDRAAKTLSGGEMQRLRLAAQLGAGLTGALYVLDEPTIGLHPRDTERLVANLKRLVGTGSTVVVVEHDADVIRAADYLVDMGPKGGKQGGTVVAAGLPREVLASDSPTAHSLKELDAGIPISKGPAQKPTAKSWLELSGATQHNLKGDTARFRVGCLNVVSGVSGSGKSSLVQSVLLPAVREALGLVTDPPGSYVSLGALGGIKRALAVDQAPIGRSPRSIPATFLGIWDPIRKLFAASNAAQLAGFSPARFSFNTPAGGRCKTCEGQGAVTFEMSFLPDVVQTCTACAGLRFEPETLRVEYLGLKIGQVLQLTVREAAQVFTNHPKIRKPLDVLVDLGAGYLTLGQGSHTLSGGEAQRLKLAAELSAGARHEPTLYVLDEPTTGLHQSDVNRLIAVLRRLVERGDTLVVVEHHPAVIASADHLIELGPEAGEEGGAVVAEGSPKAVSRKKTATGRLLAAL